MKAITSLLLFLFVALPVCGEDPKNNFHVEMVKERAKVKKIEGNLWNLLEGLGEEDRKTMFFIVAYAARDAAVSNAMAFHINDAPKGSIPLGISARNFSRDLKSDIMYIGKFLATMTSPALVAEARDLRAALEKMRETALEVAALGE